MGERYEYDAVVMGAGPNGLAAAIRIAQHGFSTLVLEGSDKVGGACRTEELTLKGFWHDVGSAVHPLAMASPCFTASPRKYGLKWIQPEVPRRIGSALGRSPYSKDRCAKLPRD